MPFGELNQDLNRSANRRENIRAAHGSLNNFMSAVLVWKCVTFLGNYSRVIKLCISARQLRLQFFARRYLIAFRPGVHQNGMLFLLASALLSLLLFGKFGRELRKFPTRGRLSNLKRRLPFKQGRNTNLRNIALVLKLPGK